MSLYELLYCDSRSKERKLLTIQRKLKLSKSLAKILYTLYNLSPPVYHGHLTPHNVMVEITEEEEFRVMVSDLQLASILKHQNTYKQYKNVTVWSAPECLAKPDKINEATKEMDIYSYGMILFEIWHGYTPFKNDLQEAIKSVLG